MNCLQIKSEKEMDMEDKKDKCGRKIIGCIMAFASGLFFTANSFVIKGTGLSFGEINAVRSIIQTLLMTFITLANGGSIWPKTSTQRIMLILVGISGSLMMLTSFACIKFMPVSDATTLMFTSPLFTIILSALTMKERLTYLKALIAVVLMSGIVLVTKPSFLFSLNDSDDLIEDSFNLNTSNVLIKENDTGIMELLPADENADFYSIGAAIALSVAILGAISNILTAKLGNEVATAIKLFYVGVFGFIMAGAAQFLDETDRFFSSDITNISSLEWTYHIGISISGIIGFFLGFKSLQMIPPATVSTLRSTEIIVACVINVILTRTIPEPFQIIGSSLVFLAVLSLIFEEQLSKSIVKLFFPKCNNNNNNSKA